jgi:predicted transcriptional regulator YdeE
MIFENVTLEKFCVAGIMVRTTNVNGQSQKDIGELWSRFMNKNISAKITDKINENLYCIYTNYESDYMGKYTAILGFQINSLGNIPEGMVIKTIPASTYQLYTSTGMLPHCVLNTWKGIWESDIKRKYLADFDIHPPDAFTIANPVVETYLSV